MHLVRSQNGIMVLLQLFASIVSHVVGACYLEKLKKEENFIVVFGDGAMEQASVYMNVCLKFASLCANLPYYFFVKTMG